MNQSIYSKTLQLVEHSLESCINTFPVELKMEILSYLHIGIIVSLFEQKKRVILYCMKMERLDRNKPFTKVFAEYSSKQLIDIIMMTETINKQYIMAHLVDYKKREAKTKAKTQEKIAQQNQIAATLQIGNYFMSVKNINYLIVGKTKGTFKCIHLGTEIMETSYNQQPIKVIRYQLPVITVAVKFTSICIPSISRIINSWLEKVAELNQSEYIKVEKRGFFLEHEIETVGIFKKEDITGLACFSKKKSLTSR